MAVVAAIACLLTPLVSACYCLLTARGGPTLTIAIHPKCKVYQQLFHEGLKVYATAESGSTLVLFSCALGSKAKAVKQIVEHSDDERGPHEDAQLFALQLFSFSAIQLLHTCCYLSYDYKSFRMW